MTQPAYTGLQREQIPAISADDGRATVNLVSGQFDGQVGPIESLTGVAMMTVTMNAGSRVTLPAPAGRAVFLYIVAGELDVDETAVKPWHLVEMNDDGDDVALVARSEAVVLFGHAEPLREPVVSHGPFVMNTHEEIQQAIEDYQSGRLGAVSL
ncbi:pirin family protein [Modicisalibacter luteus]